ncbi:MAG: SAM-dependent DNA methyltransferase, partial [Sedimentibacter sp.]
MKDNKKELIKLIEELRYKYSTWQVFSDFVEMSAISLSNSVDWLHKEKREERYLEIINSYDKKSQETFPEMFACLVNVLQDSLDTSGLTDILGQVFHDLE